MIRAINGAVLDAACGPATYGRRVASESRVIHGVDACARLPGFDVLEHKAAADKLTLLSERINKWDLALAAGSLKVGRRAEHG